MTVLGPSVPRAFRRPRHHPKPIIDCYPDDPSLVFYDNIPEHVRSLVDYTPVYDLIDQGPAHLSLAALTDYAQRLEAVLLALHAQLSACWATGGLCWRWGRATGRWGFRTPASWGEESQ